jgi:hypothetical protein
VKGIRATIASSSLLLASLLAHILAGSSTFSLHSGGLIIVVTAGIALLLSRKTGDPVRVVFAIFIAQNLGHFILGGSASSDSRMLLSHIFSGALSYQVIRYCDETLPSLGEYFQAIIPPNFSITPLVPRITGLLVAPREVTFKAFNNSHSYSLRAPPTK